MFSRIIVTALASTDAKLTNLQPAKMPMLKGLRDYAVQVDGKI